MVRSTWLVVCALAACQSPPGVPAATTGIEIPLVADSSSPPVPAPVASTPIDSAWKQRLRVGDYAGAARLFDAQYPAPTTPQLRFVRARMAFELQDAARARVLTQGLEEQLPLLATEAARLSAWALMSSAGEQPASDSAANREALALAQRQAQSSDLGTQLEAARLYQRVGQPDRARQVVDAALQQARSKAGSPLAAARRLRAELAEARGDVDSALLDYRWLAHQAPREAAALGADEALERLQGTKLTRVERYARAEAFTEHGQLAAALRELQLMETAPGVGPSPSDVLRTRAWAHYKSRQDYRTASELFTASARSDQRFRAQDLFYAARSLSRAQRDEEAIAAYRALTQKYPRSAFAEEAEFLVARLHTVLGQWELAARQYKQVLKARPGAKPSRFAGEARYGLAVASLALGEGKAAALQLTELRQTGPAARQGAVLDELLAVAYLQQGNRSQAVSLFQEVIASAPLSWPALMSAARLEQLGVRPPTVIPASPEESALAPLEVQWPPKVQLLAALGLDRDAERALAAQADSWQRAYEPRAGEALCQAYAPLAAARERYRHAQRVIKESALQRALTPATRWLWDCIYPQPYAEEVQLVARQNGLAAELIYAVMRQESAFDTQAGSTAGAMGLMQLMPRTAQGMAQELGVEVAEEDVRRVADNVRLGSAYLARQLRQFSSEPLAFAAYNAGPAAVGRWLAAAGSLPLDVFVAYIPYEETRHYVQRVTGNWARYRYLQGGEANVPSLNLTLPSIDVTKLAD